MESKKIKSTRKARSKPARKKTSAAPNKKSTKPASFEDVSAIGVGVSAARSEALRVREQQLRALFENSSADINIKDAAGRYVLTSRQFGETFRLAQGAAKGKLPHDLFPKEFADAVRAHDLAVLKTGELIEREYVIPNKYGGGVQHISKFPISNAEGEVGGLGVFAIDVTARKRAEDALRIREQQLSAFFRNSSADLVIKDVEGRYVLTSRQFEKTFGLADGEAIGKFQHDLFPKEFADVVREHDQSVLKTGQHVDRELVNPDKYGSAVRLVSKFPISDTEGGIVGLGAFAIDITERKRAEQALSDSEERYRTLVESALACIHEIDLEGRLLTMNPAGLRMMGVNEEKEISGLAYLDIVAAGEREHVAGLLSRAYEGHASEFEFTAIGNGQSRVFASSFIPIRSDDGSIAKLMGVTQDVTERKRTEEALKRSEEMLVEAQRIAQIGSWEWDLKRDEMVWSGELYRIFDVSRQQFAPSFNAFLDRVHPDDRGLIEERLDATISHDKPYSADYRIVLADGAIRFLHAAAQLERDVNGAPVRFIGTAQDVTEAHDLSEKLAFQASHDALTGLLNRREFEHRLERVLETARSEGAPHALCYLDLDQFKIINDTCGHVAGDELLRQLGALLNDRVRQRDTLARLGGDEFGVLLEHCSLDQARRVTNTLRNVIEEFRFVWEDNSFNIGVSIGLVPITKDSESVINILKQADSACYAAKDEGRNRIHIYRADDVELVKRHGEMQWAAQIQRDLKDDHFHLDVQLIAPVVGIPTDGGYYELLLRMEDEGGRRVPPSVFLAAAERYDLSTKLDRWVIATAFAWLANHPQRLGRLSLFSINLSGHSLGDKEFLEFVIRQFDETDIPPEKICFEVTETAAAANLARAIGFIKVLKQRGCRFALDDFGSGLSSFAYLKNLPVDFLKIDGMFVKHIVDEPLDLAMVKSINEIGHVMGKQTIAEFVENEAILKKLREIGVDYAQGYEIGRPKPLNEML